MTSFCKRNIQVLTLNSACRLGEDFSLEALVHMLNVRNICWDAIFCPEFSRTTDASIVQTVLVSDFGHYTQYSWHPGPGSNAMCWLVKSSLSSNLVNLHGLGRTLSFSVRLVGSKICSVVGAHAPHSKVSLNEFMSDVSVQLKQNGRRSRSSSRFSFLIGDWNTDLLPAHALDHLSHVQNRENKHRSRRMILHIFSKLKI